jgi:hypothetical protein
LGHIAAFGGTAIASLIQPLDESSRSLHDRLLGHLVEGVTVNDIGFGSDAFETRRNVKALEGLAASLPGQIVVLDSWDGDPSTIRDALATIVRLMQHSVRGIAPAGLVALLGQIDAEHLDPMKLVGLAGQFL